LASRCEAVVRSLSGRCAQTADVAQDPVETFAVDKLHGVIKHAVTFAHAKHRDDVRVVQPRRGLGLATEPLEVNGIAEAGRRKHLERHMPAEGELLGLIDDAHAAAADFAENAIITDPLRPLPVEKRFLQEALFLGRLQLLHHDESRKHLSNLGGKLRILECVLREQRPFAAPISLGEFLG
jgi:hypothetical protein